LPDTLEYEDINYTVEDPIAIIEFNREDRLNAASDKMLAELRHACAQAEADPKVVGMAEASCRLVHDVLDCRLVDLGGPVLPLRLGERLRQLVELVVGRVTTTFLASEGPRLVVFDDPGRDEDGMVSVVVHHWTPILSV